MEPIFFKDQHDFRKWLEKNHLKKAEIIAGYYKKGTGKPSMTWSESVDQALCFGWIDGIRRSIDGESYCIRFTPRRPSSTWSNVNIKKVEELVEKGLMKKEGLEAFEKMRISGAGIYSYENEETGFDEKSIALFRSNKKAWDYFEKLPPSYVRAVSRWIMSAKQEQTRLTRLGKLINACENNRRLT